MTRARYSRSVLVTAPTDEPVTIDEAMRHCRISDNNEIEYVGGLIAAAQEYIERITGRKLRQQTWDAYYNELREIMVLPFAPVVSVASVKYTDGAGAVQTSPASVYIVAERAGLPVVRTAYAQSWPSAREFEDSVIIRAVYGYAAIPSPIKHALLMLVGHWYENRETVIIGNMQNPVDFSVNALLAPYMLRSIVSSC